MSLLFYASLTCETIVLLSWAQTFLRNPRWSKKLLWLLAITLSCLAKWLCDNLQIPAPWNMFPQFALDLLILKIFYGDKLLRIFACLLTFYVVDLLLEAIAILLVATVAGQPLNRLLYQEALSISAAVISKVMLLAAVAFISNCHKAKNRLAAGWSAAYVLFIPIGTILMILFLPFNTMNMDKATLITAFLCFGYLALNLINLANFHLVKQKMRTELKAKAVQLQLENQRNQAAEQQRHEAAIQRMEHDYRHQLQYLVNLVEDTEAGYGEAKRYLNSLCKQLDSTTPIHTGNHCIDIVLNGQNRKMRELGIKLLVSEKNRVSEEIKIEEPDLIILLSNALENAGEACAGIANPVIRISIQCNETMLWLKVINPLKEPLSLKSTKTGGRHGLGLQSMKEVVDKYEGTMKIEQVGAECHLKVLLQYPYSSP